MSIRKALRKRALATALLSLKPTTAKAAGQAELDALAEDWMEFNGRMQSLVEEAGNAVTDAADEADDGSDEDTDSSDAFENLDSMVSDCWIGGSDLEASGVAAAVDMTEISTNIENAIDEAKKLKADGVVDVLQQMQQEIEDFDFDSWSSQYEDERVGAEE